MVRVPFTAALEHVYDDNVTQAIELDKHGSFLYFLPSLFVHAHAPARLFGELEASLARSQSRPHAFGLLPPAECAASSCGHQQWYAVGPSLRANSRWRRSAWPLETEDELAPVAEQLPIFAELHSPEPILTRSIVLGDCQMEDRARTSGIATDYFCRAS